MIPIATYSYNKKLINILESNRKIIINTLKYPEWHQFIWLGEKE
jgi:hypothetical protein